MKARRKHTPDELDIEAENTIIHMVGFINQEAAEKIEDIKAQTEEEYNLIKGNLIQNERLKIDAQYDKKEKIFSSKLITRELLFRNKVQLNTSAYKNKHIDDIKEEVKMQIIEDMKCLSRYGNILQLLLIEGLFMLLEPVVEIRCRERDVKLMEKVLPSVKTAYEITTSKEVELTIDTTSYLPETCLGGMVLSTLNHKIKLRNTLDERLDQIIEICQPVIQKCLFWKNPEENSDSSTKSLLDSSYLSN